MRKFAFFAIIIFAIALLMSSCSFEMSIGKGWENSSQEEQSK